MKHIETILCALGVNICSIAVGLKYGLSDALSVIGVALIVSPIYIWMVYDKK